MERIARIKHLRKFGCVLKREGRGDSLWLNPQSAVYDKRPIIVDWIRAGR